MVTKIHHMEECFGPVLAEEFCICPECGATYDYSFGYEEWLTKEEQMERIRMEEEYEKRESKPKEPQPVNLVCEGDLPW